MRGELEQKCFNTVKGKIDESAFFAITIEDERIVNNALQSAIPNPRMSEFPDFIFDNGFIEHFQVTSSATTRKGATMEREKSKIDIEFEKRLEQAIQDLPKNQITMQTVATDSFWHQTHSYDNFVKSFKSNFEHHIKSLEKYQGNTTNGIFMIEYNDSALRMSKKYPQDLMTEVSYGDLFVRENPTYRLSRDIELLKYINEMCDLVPYVIFVSNNCFYGTCIDVINTCNALEIIKLLYDGYEFHCAMVGTSQFGIPISK